MRIQRYSYRIEFDNTSPGDGIAMLGGVAAACWMVGGALIGNALGWSTNASVAVMFFGSVAIGVGAVILAVRRGT